MVLQSEFFIGCPNFFICRIIAYTQRFCMLRTINSRVNGSSMLGGLEYSFVCKGFSLRTYTLEGLESGYAFSFCQRFSSVLLLSTRGCLNCG